MIKLLDLKLKTIRDFQEKHPTSHVGGSFGLFLLGYDLQRDLSYSDLDLICPFFDEGNYRNEKDIKETSDSNDFNFKFVRDFGTVFVKHDIRIDKTQEFQIVTYEGEKYNVSLFENILKYKKDYAEKGVFKHEADIVAIETGTRPTEYRDDFPF